MDAITMKDRFRSQGKDVSVEFLDSDERSLIAVQGPTAVAALEKLTDAPLSELYFMQTTVANVAGVDGCRITRCGYTGLDIAVRFFHYEFYHIFFLVSLVSWRPHLCVCGCARVGEDGVEISIQADKAATVVDALLNVDTGNVQLAGLGARDSLRLEAGLCLYGNDIDQTTTPIEAGLAWLVGE